ncbi:31426_t:CDS:2 [Gigaspora margarita]|uniref:31426_t:CDS:1 n=1 Tax=Gigaspora margarita TaxID=4874 RepID=A0ABM8VWJ7_GIGMA|nr:31426_t:CDS:2 [Gigaspora margarita]
MKEFEEELEKQKPVLEFLLETETAELEGRKASDPTETNQDEYADLEPTEASTPEEEKGSYERTFHLCVHPIYLEHFSLEESAGATEMDISQNSSRISPERVFLGYWSRSEVLGID